MNPLRKHLIALILASATRCWSADHEVYDAFLSLVRTNPAGLNVPTLTDTNHLARPLIHQTVSLPQTKAKGQLGEIRLGMTMEQVVVCWGKPEWIYASCFGGPSFCYSGVSVVFEPTTNAVLSVFCTVPQALPRFADGLSQASDIPDFVRVLGAPDARYGPSGFSWPRSELVYVSASATLRLGFGDGHLVTLRLDRPGIEFSKGKLIPLHLQRSSADAEGAGSSNPVLHPKAAPP